MPRILKPTKQQYVELKSLIESRNIESEKQAYALFEIRFSNIAQIFKNHAKHKDAIIGFNMGIFGEAGDSLFEAYESLEGANPEADTIFGILSDGDPFSRYLTNKMNETLQGELQQFRQFILNNEAQIPNLLQPNLTPIGNDPVASIGFIFDVDHSAIERLDADPLTLGMLDRTLSILEKNIVASGICLQNYLLERLNLPKSTRIPVVDKSTFKEKRLQSLTLIFPDFSLNVEQKIEFMKQVPYAIYLSAFDIDYVGLTSCFIQQKNAPIHRDSPLNAAPTPHQKLLQLVKQYHNHDTKPFFESLIAKNYEQALRRACSAKGAVAVALAEALLSMREELGFDPNAASATGATALSVAREKGDERIVEQLEKLVVTPRTVA